MITQQCINDITNAAKIEDVVGAAITLKRAGASLVGTCPFCDGVKKLNVNKAKDIWKCFACDKGGKGSISWVMAYKNVEYINAIKILAEQYNITLEYDQLTITPKESKAQQPPRNKQLAIEKTFRDTQLQQSGLTEADQIYLKKTEDGTEIETNRYQAGTLNNRYEVTAGDDMLMFYFDLHGKPMTYNRKGLAKEFPLIRVRWNNPSLHTDKAGRAMKYQSPYGSGTHVWINETIRKKFQNASVIETLYIQEGEKKADKATKHHMPSIGIMGIHNIASDKQLPNEFEWIIKRCAVQNVVFVVDSDYLDISDNTENAADQRPKSFMTAIRNFHDYFYAFNNIGISLNIYFAHIKPEQNQKGIDDLLHNVLKGKEEELAADFKKTMLEVKGEGTYINCYKITGINQYKLKSDFFHLGSNDDFAKFHMAKLKPRKIFTIGKIKFKFSTLEEFPDLEPDTLVLAQPLTPDEFFWKESTKKINGDVITRCEFHYGNCYKFLNNRKFGRLKSHNGAFRFIKLEGSIVSDVEPYEIKDFVMDFAENALQKENVLEMLYRGAKMYVGPDSLSNLKFLNPTFHRADKGLQYLYFKEKYWKITEDGFEEKNINELDGHVWSDKIIDFKATKINKPLVEVVKNYHPNQEDVPEARKTFTWKLNLSNQFQECDFLMYLWNSSNFYWEKTNEGLAKKKNPFATGTALDEFELADITQHFISKMCAIGYMLHSHFDPNVAKAVVAMDGKLTEVGSSNGRSGKSLLGVALAKVVPTVTIAGKRKDLTEDKFLLENVNERTRIVNVDDVRVNLDFEFFFPMITGTWDINGKGIKSFQLRKEDSPKLLITTNHALNGDGGSFRDRQFLIAYSDFYNENHRPVDEHGCLFFDEWDSHQYNLFYNFIANCLQTYFKHGLIAAPMGRLEQRRLRQQIGENFLDWADSFWNEDGLVAENTITIRNRNTAIPREEITNTFHRHFPESKKYIGHREVKKKTQLYCIYRGLIFNPGKPSKLGDYGGDDKRGGIEYFTIADDHFIKS